MNKIIFSILVLSVVLASCKKKTMEPLPPVSNPVFTMQGEFNGSPINYTAGDAGIVMSAGLETRNGVRYSYGEFTDGATKFKLGIYAGNIAIPIQQGHVYEGQTLHFAQKPTQALAYFSLNQISNSAKITNIAWYANGQFIGDNNVYIYEPGVYDVMGVFTFDDNSVESITNRMYLGFENDVQFSVHHYLSDLGELKLWIDDTNKPVDSIQWSLDDQLVWTGQSCSWNIPAPEKVRVKAKVFYENGAKAEKTILVDGTFNGRFVEDFSVFQLPMQGDTWDNTVGLEVEKDGEIYRTFDVSNYKGSMEIIGVEWYVHPVTGQEMLKVAAEIDAKLKSTTSGTIISASLYVVFGLPKPS